MSKLNSWQIALAQVEGWYLTTTGAYSRKDAYGQARVYAQHLTLHPELFPVYITCYPGLLTRIPDRFADSVENRDSYDIPSPLDLVCWNIEEIVEEFLKQRWDTVHETDGYDPTKVEGNNE